MKTLRASAARLTADVVVGRNKFGSEVLTTIVLDRRDPEVIEALADLEALLTKRAHAHLDASFMNATFLTEVDKQAKVVIDRERERLNARVEERVEEGVRIGVREALQERDRAERERRRAAEQAEAIARQKAQARLDGLPPSYEGAAADISGSGG